ncbi:dihydroorotate dehydrogenase (fumarate) [Raineyella antarctica]|uniref:Dihydroorotate dehydrogenase (Fumarate) n=1 Tax=Raineyella antarctica TaxID=1577474 RepID=A0A1G6GEH1_9ACTN|nr:dihydroorotate dehydrogenase-like protein [Raineyella antarctica]SDB80412.1 dihydroorotate dehydrogenase (fumarate) [Raineyella antarctica]
MRTEPDLTTSYLGLPLRGPVIASAGPWTRTVDKLAKLQDAGAAAVVLPSLFEEDVIAEELELADMMDTGEEFAEFASPPAPLSTLPEVGTTPHLRLVEEAKAALEIPVIASLNATHHGSWERYARQLAEAGADALELNLYTVGADPALPAAELESRQIDIISSVANSIDVPLAVKVSAYYTSFSHFAAAAVASGADGLVVFNRFYAPDISLETLKVEPRLSLSRSDDLRLSLRWLAILRAQLADTGLAATGGVHGWGDVVKALLVGADVACTTGAVIKDGPQAITAMIKGVRGWLDEHEYESVEQLRGSMSAASVPDPSAYERGQYRTIVTS